MIDKTQGKFQPKDRKIVDLPKCEAFTQKVSKFRRKVTMERNSRKAIFENFRYTSEVVL